MLKWTFRKWDVGEWTGSINLRTGAVTGTCEYGNEPSGSKKMLGITWLAANLLASQDGHCFME